MSEHDQLPATQPIDDRVLKDVVAYIEVRSDSDNRTRGIAKQIELLGATVVPKFSNDVTHVVFKGGKRTTKQKAQKQGAHVVSVLWVESCRKNHTHMSERLFPVASPGKATPAGLVRLRKLKSMQPKEFDEEVAHSVERQQRKQKVRDKKIRRHMLFNTPEQESSPVFIAETQPRYTDVANTPLFIPETPKYMKSRLQEKIKQKLGGSFGGGNDATVIDDSASFSDTNSPVHYRLYNSSSTAESPILLSKSCKKRYRGDSNCDSDYSSDNLGLGNESSNNRNSPVVEQGSTIDSRSASSVLQPTKKKRKLMTLAEYKEPSSRVCSPKETSRLEVSGTAVLLGNRKPSITEKTTNNQTIRAHVTAAQNISGALVQSQCLTSHVCEVLKNVAPTRASMEEFKFTLNRQKKHVTHKSHSSSRNSSLEGKKNCNKSSIFLSSSLVMTSLHVPEQELVISILRKLGGFDLQDIVGCDTTHIICGDKRRTLNVLFGIAQGCWILSLEWILMSLEAGEWQPEEMFEQHEWFPTARLARKERIAVGNSYKQALFTNCGAIYVVNNTNPPQEKLTHLLKLCGGNVTSCYRKAAVCVGGLTLNKNAAHVSEKWILDSVEFHKSLPLKQYLIRQSERLPSPEF